MDELDRFPAQRHVPREDPLEPLCALGVGPVALRLAEHLLTWPEQSHAGERCLADLRAAKAADTLFVLGESVSLPWVDGVSYLGRDVAAPELLLPTHSAPSLPLGWLRASVLRGAADELERAGRVPFALIFEPPRVVSLAAARVLTRADLQHWHSEFCAAEVPP